MTALAAHIVVAARGVDASVTVGPGRTLVLLGANGSGKSTTLEAIAGTIPMDGGTVTVDGRALVGGGRAVPARDRRIGLLSQDDALFSTMTVRDNVAFGPRSRGASLDTARADADQWLARVGLAGMGGRRPVELSGGQARRVAIARALAASPHVVLLDEPFAGLDVVSASEIRGLVALLLTDLTAIIATHDALDAYALADDVAVMQAGSVVESGHASRVLTRPRSAFAARLAARVLVTGTMTEGALMLASGVRVPVVGGPELGASAAIAVRPARIVIGTPGQAPSDRAVWVEDTITALEPRGDEVRVQGRSLAADVDVAEAATLSIGASIAFGVPTGAEAYAL